MNQAIAERERFSEKNRELIDKISTMRDELKDKDLQIEEYMAKMDLLKGTNRIMTEQKDMLQKKIDHIYENNILINKEGKSTSNKEEEEQNKEQSAFMNNVQEEVRKLHFQLKQKDTVIHKLTQLAERKGSDEYGTEEDSKAEIDKILQGSVEPEQSKGQERQLIELLSQKEEIEKAYISDCCFSTLINPHDIKEILKNHNELLADIKKFDESNRQFKSEIDSLKTTLNNELQKEQPDIDKITKRIVTQELDALKKEFDVIRSQLEKDLHNRIDKVIKLELQLEEVKDAYKQLEHSISRDDLKFKQKAQNLEKNLEQIHQMYQNVTSEKSILKVDL